MNLPGPPEIWLSALVWALYVADCLRLVYYNEVLIEVDLLRAPSVHVHLPSTALRTGSRHIALLPLLTPHAPVFRAAWMSAPDADAVVTPCARALAAARGLRDLAAPAVLLWATLLVGLPAWLMLGEPLFGLFLLCLLLACEALLIGGLLERRRALGLSGVETAQILFECIVCPPNAINLPRKLAVRMTPHADLLAWLEDGSTRVRVHDGEAFIARASELLTLSGEADDGRLRRYKEALAHVR